ncbi:hypothetical protein [Kitasatospora sp. GP82]|uniref:helix-hairpin-helix domain-containing protein n=1 Tax=Kitasatospora sp. GP82 TaxID=3035089 RepID=UPI002475876B|nr:hypothetical protein [Kitasatospora sp. GP82]MDH6130035.1 DNA polymerase III alpha subunit [Kitasatospora sp. GP82]
MPSVVGLLEQHERAARRRVDGLREEADRIHAELASAEREWEEWAIARRRVDAVLAPVGDNAAGPQEFQVPREGESIGVFQLESPGQKELLGRLQPTTFEDLIAEISLFRPGPVQADMIKPFILGRHGKAPVRYPHPDLEPWLRPTYGVVIFNEQVAGLFATMTRSDLAMGEEARRALAKPERIPALEAWYRQRAAVAGYTPQAVDEVWDMLKSMGAYGFAKAHAVAFALPTLQSAWLKSHYPAAFTAGLLEHDPGMYPKRFVLNDARRRGVPILPLDVQHSAAQYRTELDPDGRLGIRISLADVHGISQEQAQRIADSRPYSDIGDFWVRARPSLPIAERLARIGALDSLAPGIARRDLLLQLDELHRQHASAAIPEQMVLTAVTAPTGATGLPEMTPLDQMQAELEVIGMDASRHLMEPYHPLLAELGVTPAHRLKEVPTGETVLVAGAKIAIQTPPMKSGRRTIFVCLDDGSQGGQIDLAYFDDTHDQAAYPLFHTFVLLARGTVSRRGKSATIVGSRAWSLVEVAEAHRAGGTAAVRRLLADQQPGDLEAASPTAVAGPDTPSVPARNRVGAGRLFHASQGSAG